MTITDPPQLAAAPHEDRPYGDGLLAPPRSRARRNTYAIAIVVVAGVAARNSYWHIVAVASTPSAKQDPFLAYSLPLSIDGMLLVATLAIAEDKANNRRPRVWARFAFWLGAVASIAANMASDAVDIFARDQSRSIDGMDPLFLAVSAWPPIALLVVVEIMARPGKPRRQPGQLPIVREAPAAPVSPARTAEQTGASAGDVGSLDPGDVAAVIDMIAPAKEAAELAEQGNPLSRETLTENLRQGATPSPTPELQRCSRSYGLIFSPEGEV